MSRQPGVLVQRTAQDGEAEAAPMAWPLVPLDRVVLFNPKDSDHHNLSDDTPVSFVPMNLVSDQGSGITAQAIRPLGEVRRGYSNFKNKDVLFAKITPCMENGKSAIAYDLKNGLGFGSTEFHILRPRSDILPSFLHYFLRRQSFRTVARGYMRGGAGQQRLPVDFLRNELIPLPTLPEQRQIVDVLHQADHLRRLQANSDAKAALILPAIFIKMFGDPGKNLKGWTTRPFRELLIEPPRNGLSPSSAGTFAAKVLTLSAVTSTKFDESAVKDRRFSNEPPANKRVDPNDFLICRGNGNLGLVGRGRFPNQRLANTVFPDTIIAAKIDQEQVVPAYLEALWDTRWMRLQIESISNTTSGIHKINQTTLGTLAVRLPPMALQNRFGILATALRRSIETRRSDSLDRLFGVLSHRAFSGQLALS